MSIIVITPKELSEVDDKKLSQLLGDVLQPKKNRHESGNYGDELLKCKRCGVRMFRDGEPTPAYGQRCPKFPGILLTPGNQIRWRDWGAKKFGYAKYRQALVNVYFASSDFDINVSFDEWLCTKIQPKHYITAAAVCELDTGYGK